MIKLWNGSQLKLLEQMNPLFGDVKLPQEVIAAVKDMIEILDQNYGPNRHPEEDLGGYVCILEKGTIGESEDYNNLLAEYSTSVDMAEFTDLIIVPKDKTDKEESNYQWYLQGYVLSSDFTLTILYKDII